MTAPRYSRDELARLETRLRGVADLLEVSAADLWEAGADNGAIEDLHHAADFLAETVGVLDKQKRRRQRRAAVQAIEAKKRRGK